MSERATSAEDDGADGFGLHEVHDSDAREQHATVAPEVQLCFEECGSHSDPLVLLVMGLGLDLCWWRDVFFTRWAGRGFHAVRFDRSLVSIMGRPGDKRTGRVAKSMLPEFLRVTPADPGRAVEHLVKNFRRTGSIHRTVEDDEDVRIAMRRSSKSPEWGMICADGCRRSCSARSSVRWRGRGEGGDRRGDGNTEFLTDNGTSDVLPGP
ncbi:MAG: hypothetical protein M3065_06370 [Actinomycetota bacterium]|nr:hypothetical protein [Actinomycetota bacterium]